MSQVCINCGRVVGCACCRSKRSKPGRQWVKNNRKGERFWVLVHQAVIPGQVFGMVDNDLKFTDRHGFKRGHHIQFPSDEILGFCQEKPNE